MYIENQSFQNERKRHEIKKLSYRKWHYERKVTKKIKDENEIKLKIRNIKYVVGLLIKMRHR